MSYEPQIHKNSILPFTPYISLKVFCTFSMYAKKQTKLCKNTAKWWINVKKKRWIKWCQQGYYFVEICIYRNKMLAVIYFTIKSKNMHVIFFVFENIFWNTTTNLSHSMWLRSSLNSHKHLLESKSLISSMSFFLYFSFLSIRAVLSCRRKKVMKEDPEFDGKYYFSWIKK